MELQIQNNELIIKGNVKSIQDAETIKEALEKIAKKYTSIKIVLQDSISLTSSVIGYLVKLAQKDGKNITLKVANEELYELLRDLDLHTIFKIQRL